MTRRGDRADLALTVLVVVLAVPLGVRGPGYVLDDWYFLANAAFGDTWSAAGRDVARARPGSAVVYAVVFGLVGRRPLVVFGLLTSLNVGVALLLRGVVAKIWDASTGLAVAVVWVLLPNHTSLSSWPSATPITVSLVLTLAGLLALVALPGAKGAVLAGAALGLAVLTYEATAPLAALGAWWLAPRDASGHSRSRRAIALAGPVVSSMWIFAFWHPAKRGLDRSADASLLLPAHFGWGVLPEGAIAGAAVVVASVAIAVVVGRAIYPATRLGDDERLVLTGAAVIVAGFVPYARYVYEPLGAGDRANAVSSLGAAVVWVGFGRLLWRSIAARTPVVPIAVTALVAAGFVAVHLDAARAWSKAGDDAASVFAQIERGRPCPDVVTARATPPRRNVSGVIDETALGGLVALACGSRGHDAELLRAATR